MYRYLREGRAAKGALVALALASLTALWCVEAFKVQTRQPHFEEKRDAVDLELRMMQAVRAERLKRGLSLDPVNDPFGSGLIGVDDFNSIITTDRGDLKSKLISTNPYFSAVVVDYLKKAGVKKGQYVAIGWTGSFPGFNMAVLAAVETLGLKPLIITSIGASTWGANMDEWTWLDIERTLFDAGLIHSRSLAASLGGSKDRARGISAQGRKMLQAAATRNGIPLIEEKGVEEFVHRRLELYRARLPAGRRLRAYINVGGGVSSAGSNFMSSKLVPSGLSRKLPLRNYPVRSVLVELGGEGVPVIHLLNARELARANQLPLDAAPAETAKQGKLFFVMRYNFFLALALTLLLTAATVLVVRVDLRLLYGRSKMENP